MLGLPISAFWVWPRQLAMVGHQGGQIEGLQAGSKTGLTVKGTNGCSNGASAWRKRLSEDSSLTMVHPAERAAERDGGVFPFAQWH